ncbi:MAG: ribonuclease III, partial [Lachnospiraceae bacterium]|nr:ribonuclease III [Lachnospiraceae bacterium]
HAHILNDVEGRRLFYDAKSILQEKAQAAGRSIRYELVSEDGPAHDRNYVSAVFIDDICRGEGSGRSRKLSEQYAAYAALQEEWTG